MRKMLSSVMLLTLHLQAPVWADSPQPANTPVRPQAVKPAASETLPTPLPADKFYGRVRQAYQAVAEIPDVIAQLSCYCGCDKAHGHRNLLDCFVDDHGAGCAHCMNEALDAHALFMSGASPEEIRAFIDNKYGPKP
jgi:hypothetical protein